MTDHLVLFGGTFDPVHHGHLIVARAVAEQCDFGRITFVLSGTPPHKRPAIGSAEHRLAMLRCAIAGEEIFDVCDLELGRAGPSYTLETLQALRRRHGSSVKLHWLIGTDMLEDLPNWHGAEQVVRLAEIIIAARAPWPERMGDVFGDLAERLGPEQAKRLRRAVVPTPLIDISSTRIRNRLKAGQSIRFLVPESVRAYIEQQGLYAADVSP